jgi:DNA adenine methylase
MESRVKPVKTQKETQKEKELDLKKKYPKYWKYHITQGTGLTAPFGRMGGKSKIANELISKFPSQELFKYYVEPFVGAGNVFFRKPETKGQVEVISDLDSDVYKIMKALKTKNKHLNDNINRAIDREYFESIKHKSDPISTLEKLKSSYFKMGRSFNTTKGGDTHTYIKKDFTPYKERLKNTIILNKSFEKVVGEYDSPQTFFYLDPPYESETQKDYKDYVTPKQVYDVLSKVKGKFMLSYNDSPNIRKLFKDFKIHTINTTYENTTFSSKKKKREVYITNY